MKKKCEYCGKDFITNVFNKKYCNQYCGGKARRERYLVNKELKKKESVTNE